MNPFISNFTKHWLPAHHAGLRELLGPPPLPFLQLPQSLISLLSMQPVQKKRIQCSKRLSELPFYRCSAIRMDGILARKGPYWSAVVALS